MIIIIYRGINAHMFDFFIASHDFNGITGVSLSWELQIEYITLLERELNELKKEVA
jgi:hypothetical protein